MNFLRNTLAVILGLIVAALIITLGVRLNPSWITYEQFTPFKKWEYLLYSVRKKDYFFVALLISSGIGAMIGGVVTALVVKRAKVAYAILIGLILLFIAILDVIVFPFHPTFYKILIFIIFFPFSWIGGEIVEIITNFLKRKKINK